jgi:transcriptional regulator with XRE-family HTH domain
MNTARTITDWRAAYLKLTGLLVRRREAQRISQQDLADRLGIGRRTLQRWEHGDAEPPAMRLFQWGALLGVSIAPDVAQVNEEVEA